MGLAHKAQCSASGYRVGENGCSCCLHFRVILLGFRASGLGLGLWA